MLKTDNQEDHKRRARVLGREEHLKRMEPIDPAERLALEEMIDGKQAGRPTVAAFAKAAHLEFTYLSIYAYLCGAVHSTLDDVGEHIPLDSEGKPRGILRAPFVNELGLTFLLLGEAMLLAVEAIDKLIPLTLEQIHETNFRHQVLIALSKETETTFPGSPLARLRKTRTDNQP